MLIMIIFLILSVVFVIGTVIYLNQKKKKVNNTFKQTSSIDTRKDIKSNKKEKKQLADILQFKIKDNIICLGSRYSNVIR